jgi:uncharacterized protein
MKKAKQVKKDTGMKIPGISDDEFEKAANKKKAARAKMRAKLEEKQMPVEDYCAVGDDYFLGENGRKQSCVEAAKWYRKAAEAGHAEAQEKLAHLYLIGKGVKKSEKTAVEWLRKAAEQGYAKGQMALARCYLKGKGVKKSEKEAAKLIRKMAEQGDARAQYLMGLCYEKGVGVEESRDEAFEWYRKSAEQTLLWV